MAKKRKTVNYDDVHGTNVIIGINFDTVSPELSDILQQGQKTVYCTPNQGVAPVLGGDAKNFQENMGKIVWMNPMLMCRRTTASRKKPVQNKNDHTSSDDYVTINGTLYFVVGKTRIKVVEHFQQSGPEIMDLLENIITYSAKSA